MRPCSKLEIPIQTLWTGEGLRAYGSRCITSVSGSIPTCSGLSVVISSKTSPLLTLKLSYSRQDILSPLLPAPQSSRTNVFVTSHPPAHYPTLYTTTCSRCKVPTIFTIKEPEACSVTKHSLSSAGFTQNASFTSPPERGCRKS